MADLKSHQPIISNLPAAVPTQASLNVNLASASTAEFTPTISGNLLQVSTTPSSVATANQENAKYRDDTQNQQETHFEAPIVVGEEKDSTIVVKQKANQLRFDDYQPQKPQFNVQILFESDQKSVPSNTVKVVNGHTNSNNYQYLVEDKDQDILGSTPSTTKEAPSRQFLKNFKKFHTAEYSTTSQSYSTSTTRTVVKSTTNGCCPSCCKLGHDCCAKKEVAITPRPIPNAILAPVHAGVRLTNEKLDDCIDGHEADKKAVVEVKKNVKTIVSKKPVFGDRIFYTTKSPPITQSVFIEQSTAPPRQQVFIQKSPAPTVYIEQPKPTVVPQLIIQKTQAPPAVFHQPIVVEKEIIKEVPVDRPVVFKSPPETKFVDRPVLIKSPPEIIEKIVHKPIIKTVEKPVFIENYVKEPVEVEKIVDRPVFIKSPPETKIVQQPVIVEKAVIKEVKVPVEKTVYIKSPPETKIVHQPVIQTVEKPVFIEKIVKQPVEVEKIVERIVDRPIEKIVEKPIIQTVEKPVFIEKIVDRPVEKIIEKPVIQTVEKIVDRPVYQTVEKIVERPVIQTVEKPVYIEKIVDRPVEKIVEKPIIQTVEKIVEKPVFQTVEKFIDRPYPVPYAVPFEKHVYHKPDFHVIAKAIPHKHKLFDFESLFSFLTKKEEVKHIYVPASSQYQLNQLNKHQLTYSTIEPIKESPVLDYGRYATSHLSSIKPVYGVPTTSTLLKPISNTYSSPDPYSGN